MRAFVFAAALLVGCRPAESAPQASGAPAGGTPAATATSDAADAMLARADQGRIQGNVGATTWIVEVSDFQCPFCKMWHDSVYPTLKREFIDRGQVRLAYINFPLKQHANALPTAQAAMCAAAQGRFWPMHDALFASQARWAAQSDASATLESLAKAAGVNLPEWRDCVRGGVMQRLISADRQRGTDAGVSSTPSFFIGDEVISGVAPLDSFRLAINRARAKSAAAKRP
jgi:protein-disulfide isomerase